MKSFITALTIFIFVISVSIFGAYFTDGKLKRFEDEIEGAIPQETSSTSSIYNGAMLIEKSYENLEKYLILFIHDDGVREIEEHIADIKSAALTGELSDAITAKNRLILHIKQLRRLSKFSPEAIF